MRKIVFLLFFLAVSFTAMLAATSTQFNNASTSGSYTSAGAISVSNSTLTSCNTKKVTCSCTISFQANVPASLLTAATGGSFSGGSFAYSSVPNVGTGTAANVSGTLTVTSNSTGGSGSTTKYQLTMTFSGYDSMGKAFSGTSTQLLTVKVSSKGQISSVSGNGGSTTITE